MKPWKFLALGAAAAGITLMVTATATTPANAQANVRDHRTTNRPVVRDHRTGSQPVVRDHRKTTQTNTKSSGVVSATGSGIKKGAKTVAGVATAPVRGAVNAGSRVVGGAKKVGGAIKSVGKKLNPFD